MFRKYRFHLGFLFKSRRKWPASKWVRSGGQGQSAARELLLYFFLCISVRDFIICITYNHTNHEITRRIANINVSFLILYNYGFYYCVITIAKPPSFTTLMPKSDISSPKWNECLVNEIAQNNVPDLRLIQVADKIIQVEKKNHRQFGNKTILTPFFNDFCQNSSFMTTRISCQNTNLSHRFLVIIKLLFYLTKKSLR